MNKSTLIERLRTAADGFPIIAEHPSKLMNEAADRLEESEAQLEAAQEIIEAWKGSYDVAMQKAEAQLAEIARFATELAPRYDDGRLYSATKRETAYDISKELQAILEKQE